MSDYISKSKAVESLKKYKFGAICNDEEREYTKETVLLLVNGQPTLDEKEIIRKTAERIIDRLEYKEKQYESRAKKFEEALNTWEESRNRGKACSYGYAIEIVKEECGINE